MVNWTSAQEIGNDTRAFSNLMHCLLGLYIWEWATSLEFDWLFITGKKEFKWPMIFYFLNRYCLLFALIGIAIALNVTEEINCQGLYTFNQCFGNAAIGLASINLSIRTMATWGRRWYIVCPIVLVILGHWSLLLHGILLKASWINGQCVITQTDSKLLAATFIYSMVFDFLVLVLTGYKLFDSSNHQGKLARLIFRDGLIYFIIAFLANLLATIFMLLNLNPVMSIIANVPAAICSTIVACRSVRRLDNWHRSAAAETFKSNTSSWKFSGLLAKFSKTTSQSEGVVVQMSTFQSPTGKSEYDSAGNNDADVFDPEAQTVGEEFKRPAY